MVLMKVEVIHRQNRTITLAINPQKIVAIHRDPDNNHQTYLYTDDGKEYLATEPFIDIEDKILTYLN